MDFFLKIGHVFSVQIARSLGSLSIFFLLNFGPLLPGGSTDAIIYFLFITILDPLLADGPFFAVAVLNGRV